MKKRTMVTFGISGSILLLASIAIIQFVYDVKMDNTELSQSVSVPRPTQDENGSMAEIARGVEETLPQDPAPEEGGDEFVSQYFSKHFSDFEGSVDVGAESIFPSGSIEPTFSYKLAGALYMLGYRYDKSSPELAIEMLNRFQLNNNIPRGTVVDRDTMRRIDTQLQVVESRIQGYALKFDGLLNNIDPGVEENIFPKDFIAWIFLYPLEILPPYLQIQSTAEMAACIAEQCVGSMRNIGGRQVFHPDIFYPAGVRDFPNTLEENIRIVLHEYAHYLDDFGTTHNKENRWPHEGMIATHAFTNIAFEHSDILTLAPEERPHIANFDYFLAECNPLKTDLDGFLTRYAYYAYDLMLSPKRCPEGTSSGRKEDFAETFSYYVASGQFVRRAAQQNTFIARRYDWLKNNVFQGVEYDTDLRSSNVDYSGCTDGIYPSEGPGYVSCSRDNVWSGYLQGVTSRN